jgi:hypothetical protein
MIDALKRASAEESPLLCPTTAIRDRIERTSPVFPSPRVWWRTSSPVWEHIEFSRWTCMPARFRVLRHPCGQPVCFPHSASLYKGTFQWESGYRFSRCRRCSQGPCLCESTQSGLALIDKRRSDVNQAEALNIIGEVAGKTAVVLDDMVDTAERWWRPPSPFWKKALRKSMPV